MALETLVLLAGGQVPPNMYAIHELSPRKVLMLFTSYVDSIRACKTIEKLSEEMKIVLETRGVADAYSPEPTRNCILSYLKQYKPRCEDIFTGRWLEEYVFYHFASIPGVGNLMGISEILEQELKKQQPFIWLWALKSA